ncbi:MAG TPA: glycoside hydrolase family 2 TIM barrel-domain containing protein [Oligoflexus sp.]|uniref:glycoside hydrolase family 2 TIM barrel-domain containing protein n=1 Tax=Oligoflexus sp. TaxID=1971216 RepID=UPI002D7EB80D|nr:glycoside hydrolase family 2 TIM barrel-domain containing protein [Oligoflexus sp.]HET9239670.1 glycoside hydrolase family 2 TIM barrel-domain containing protein [Oligoflexus sp.]
MKEKHRTSLDLDLHHLHPRPQFCRKHWHSLNGPWKFCYDDTSRFQKPSDVAQWDHTIEVPFAPETERSGIGDVTFHSVCWYQREFQLPLTNQERLLLHFGAVDYLAQVWVNDQFVGRHEGGHTPFHFDITHCLNDDGPQIITVKVEDNPQDLAKPRGKQDWQLEPHSIWYPRTTGIWQTVWLEPVPETYIGNVRWTPHLERWEIGFEAFIEGCVRRELQIRLKLTLDDQVLVNDSYQVILGEVHRRIALSDPGVDDFRNELLWSPEKPTLIKAQIELYADNECVDRMHSYTALRSVSIQHGDFLLNGRPYYLRMVLDQGYWPESFMTAPDGEALKRDIELVKAMGFNGVRKHQKIEDPQFLFWADVLGLTVWEEMPSAYRFTHEGVERITREWIEAIDRDYSHPCIVTWVPFNESWGVPDLAEKASHRSCVQALYHLTKTLDPTRPVIGNDGWESTATDIIGIHDYDNHPAAFKERYDPALSMNEILNRRSPAGKMITIEGYNSQNQPIMLTEFGGIAFTKEKPGTSNAWGYAVCTSSRDLKKQYSELLSVVHQLKLFRGFCYTQFTDTFQEANGLLFADRTPKIDIETLAMFTRGFQRDRAEITLEDADTAGQQMGCE